MRRSLRAAREVVNLIVVLTSPRWLLAYLKLSRCPCRCRCRQAKKDKLEPGDKDAELGRGQAVTPIERRSLPEQYEGNLQDADELCPEGMITPRLIVERAGQPATRVPRGTAVVLPNIPCDLPHYLL